MKVSFEGIISSCVFKGAAAMWLFRPGLAIVLGLTVIVSAAAQLRQTPTGATAGAVPAAALGSVFVRETNLDRSGSDIRSDKLAANAGIEACELRCVATSGCVAYTFVKRSTTVPEPICWLKSVVPVGYPSECCISGVRQAAGK